MSYKRIIMSHAPDYWNELDDEITTLQPYSEEYQQLAHEVKQAIGNSTKRILRIDRIQNVHDLGQMLVRAQLLINANPHFQYYKARRFIQVRKQYLDNALKYNLDHRRCGLPKLVFNSSISHTLISNDDVLVVVQVITTRPDDSVGVEPANNLEYFIDYVVYF